ncbi:synaptojanin-1 [Pararge aegeria]|uniref:phosphoinositide 5-phosphatase n=5 Tax=Pararge aegeria TaxID=116150 RepID=A0A8S4S5R0_9NEOP|nr:synaptojanin-1 [Pararge aegeria]CAH2244759.1 jg5595 [Pararge aegeria aegeria]
MAMSKGFKVLEKSTPPNPYSIILQHRNKDSALLFESQAVVSLSSQETDTLRKQYHKVADAYGCLGVLQLNSGESCLLYLVLITGCCSVGKVGDIEVFKITQTQFLPLFYQSQGEDKVSEVRKLLNSGTFYFSWNSGKANDNLFDLTLCAQRKSKGAYPDNRFFWNRTLFIHLIRYGIDCDDWLTRAMCGSVEIRTIYVGHRQARAVLVSRLSCERAGTRFNVRGCNDDGNVANFVETEQAIYIDDSMASYIQTRGSVPLFWEQPGIQVGSHKVKMSRGYDASTSACDRHFSQLKRNYGSVVVVNLLGSSLIGGSEGEATLSNAFQRHLNESAHNDISQIIFDYHQEVRAASIETALSKFKKIIEKHYDGISIFSARGLDIYNIQKGVIRTNCLDCLDRTNAIQTFIGLEMLAIQLMLLQCIDKKQNVNRFEEVFKQMWINNGNEVSKIYAGTGAIQGGSKLIDGARSAARTIQNNLLDNSKQEAIDILLLGSTLNSELSDRTRILLPPNILHTSTAVLREMCRRAGEFTQPSNIRITIGTYNVNGGKHFRSLAYKDVSLADWLLDCPNSSLVNTVNLKDHPSDIFAIGFQEIVDLNASNIMAASSDNAKAWSEELEKILARDASYTLLSCHQLVGVCLFVFARKDLIPHIRDIALDSVKTGLGGTTGNKGAVAIRLVIYGTSICFVCAHFAAGQSQVTERNADYTEITRKIAFPMGRSLYSHDYVFWCGDFNYRIDLDKEETRLLAAQNSISRLLENDQLLKQKSQDLVFKNCFEGEITFLPTYKYDLFSDDYDTSEKCRAPAWTDRILWRSRKNTIDPETTSELALGKLLHYGRAELKQSDHRPVIAILEIEVLQVSYTKCMEVFYEVVTDLGPPDASITVQPLDEIDNEDSIFDDNVMSAVLQELATIGEVTLVRFIEDQTLSITFRDGQHALAAAQKGKIMAGGIPLSVSLKSPDWVEIVRSEISLCSNNTIPLFGEIPAERPLRSAPPTPRRQQPSRPPAPSPTPLVPSRAPAPSPARPPPPRPAPLPQDAATANVASPTIVSPPADSLPPPTCAPPPLPASNPPPPTGPPPPVPARQGAPPPLPARPRPVI